MFKMGAYGNSGISGFHTENIRHSLTEQLALMSLQIDRIVFIKCVFPKNKLLKSSDCYGSFYDW